MERLGLWGLPCAPLQWYRARLCAIDLCVLYTMLYKGDPPFFESRGHPRQLGGAQGDFLCTMVHNALGQSFLMHFQMHHSFL